MTIRQLEYFVTAAHTLNFTVTAQQFFISQSAVTQQIKALENELGAKIFNRKNNVVSLTPAGEALLPDAEQIIEITHESIKKVHAVRDGMNGSLRIGYLQSMEMTRFPKSIQRAKEDYPGIQLLLNRDDAASLHSDYLKGKYDVIINIDDDILSYPGTTRRVIGEYRYYVAVPPTHRFANRRKITQEDLQNEKLIIHAMDASVPENLKLTPPPYLTAENLKQVTVTENDVETILILVAARSGIAIIPEFDIYNPQVNLQLNYIPLDTGDYRVKLSLFYPEKGANPLLRYFLSEI